MAQTKIGPILNKLKAGVSKKDVSIFKDIVSFPLNINSSKRYVSSDGYMKIKTRKIKNTEQF
jgi:hypothetical protein